MDAAHQAELLRLRAMTARERMVLALKLGLRCAEVERRACHAGQPATELPDG
jgi:hypothetical protein